MIGYPLEIIGFVFVAGLCVGSFLNVCIWRIPEGRSIVSPPSSCPCCGYRLRFYDNIPILSYLWLRGRCRQCQSPISLRYPVVELMTGLVAVALLFRFGLTLYSLIYFIFLAVLLVITFIDIDHQIIPNSLSLPGIPLFFCLSLALPSLSAVDSLIGIGVGGGSLLLVAWTYERCTGREGMGMGDVKLLALIGALIGWQGVLVTIFVGSVVGTVIGSLVMVAAGKNSRFRIPFGPFLSLGAMVYVFFGPELILWYLNLARVGAT